MTDSKYKGLEYVVFTSTQDESNPQINKEQGVAATRPMNVLPNCSRF